MSTSPTTHQRGRSKADYPNSRFVDVTRRNICPICGKPDWCRVSEDGKLALCHRHASHPALGPGRPGSTRLGPHWSYRIDDPTTVAPYRDRAPAHRADVSALAASFAAGRTAEHDAALAREIGVPAWSFDACAPDRGWCDDVGAHVLIEHDGDLRPVGLQRRSPSGNQRAVRGTSRGLTVPADFRDRIAAAPSGTLYVVEGATDVLAMHAAGLLAVGRCTAAGGVADLARLFRDLPDGWRVVVVVEHDRRWGGRWAGRAGAYRVGSELSAALGRAVSATYTPDEIKDVRAWLVAKTKKVATRRRWQAAGRELDRKLSGGAVEVNTNEPPEAATFHAGKCGRPYHVCLKGKSHKSAAGKRATAAFRCRRYSCPGCRKFLLSRWSKWLRLCCLWWGDPVRCGRYGVAVPAGLESTVGRLVEAANKAGPWDLYAGVVSDAEWKSLRRTLANRRCEFTRIRVGGAGAEVFPGNQVKNHPVKEDLTSGENLSLVLVALRPGEDPVRGLRHVCPDDAVGLLNRALENVPDRNPDPHGKRYSPVTTSDGWRPVEEDEESRWEVEGKSAHPVEAAREIAAALGASPDPDAVHAKTVVESAAWRDAELGGPLSSGHFADLLSPLPSGGALDRATVVRLHRAWRPLTGGLPDGPTARGYIRDRIDRPPLPDDVAGLAAAAERDAEIAARAVAEAPALAEGAALRRQVEYQVAFGELVLPDGHWLRQVVRPELLRPCRVRRRRRIGEDLTDTPEYETVMRTIAH